ncbi:hypothetical protein [Parendozoicomonas sp. Alg238-R29]|uniref:hypothetical protein n=1 Tax=Parendozoicomonas sp. Alg238-R29 TaxID=2993446 RepID=UPI00248EDE13|nr:hypothetical protein [Parendozoicomonas sp. Alg238-R29]
MFRRLLPLIIGISLQFLMMPLLAYGISHWWGLSAALMTGMILVGTAPGGTASNVLTYLAGEYCPAYQHDSDFHSFGHMTHAVADRVLSSGCY